MKIGLIGCGNISSIYLENLRSYRQIEVGGVADLDQAKAIARAEAFGVLAFSSPSEMFGDSSINLLVNLTTPESHFRIAEQALQAGKHVYNEKPLTLTSSEARELCRLAEEKGLRVGAAPDTFLGAGHQACIAAIRQGEIGEPVAAEGFMMCHGHESWHPSPEFYYKKGGGPLFDMGPYYLTALVAMIGPVSAVSALSRTTFAQRTITSDPLRGTTIHVETPTHISASLQFASGALGTMIMSFDVWHHQLPNIEIHGREGSLSVPDPNGFGGQPMIRRKGDSDWQLLEVSANFAENSRGLGVLDMADAIAHGRPHLASGELAAHVVEVMDATLLSANENRTLQISSAPPPPDRLMLIESEERANK